MPSIISAWRDWADSSDGPEADQRSQRLEFLRGLQQAGGQMTWGVPGVACQVAADWLGERLAWWPRGVSGGRRVGLVSSRLGRDMDRHKSWFAALRTACIRLDPTRDVLLTSEEVASQRFVRRCGQLFGVPVLCLETDGDGALEDWSQRILAGVVSPFTAPHRVCLSPSVTTGESSQATGEQAAAPTLDRAMMALSDLLVVLHIRPNGNIHRLLESRLARPEFSTASVFLALGDGLVPRRIAEPLMDMGAVGWYMMDPDSPADQDAPPPWAQASIRISVAAPIIDCPPAEDWPYLTHCTRRRLGPWPDQAEDAYLDDLLLDRGGADHSAFAALWRIVRNQRLLASSDLVRGDEPVVSLTAAPLAGIHHLRTFRSHLGRWDFEPYGICIRRDWLQQHGARPVHYGDSSLWEELPVDQRPFFQKRQSQTGKGVVIDWTVEREWRLIGDLRLDKIPHDAAIVFVPTRDEAQQLATASRWPVAVVAQER